MTYNDRRHSVRRWVLAGVLSVVLTLGGKGRPAYAQDTGAPRPGQTTAAAVAFAATAVVPQPAGLPEKRLIPAAVGIPPGSTEEALPSNLLGAGIIDPNSAQNSGDPGVLVPLAQAQSSTSHWLNAVEAAGPETPLSDPEFTGTIFIPNNAAFEAAYPQLKSQDGIQVFSDVQPSLLAAQLNSLTVPGTTLRLDQLKPDQGLKTADHGMLTVVSVNVEAGSAKLQHLSSGTTISVTEPNLQSGNAVAHVVNSLLPPAPAASMTEQAAAADPGGRYESAMTILRDPVQKLRAFATLVQQARLTDLLADAGNELTLFAPSDEAMQHFLQSLSPPAQHALSANSSLADALVSGHLVSGVALGSKALEALLPEGELNSQAGAVLQVQQQSRSGQMPTPTAVEGQAVSEAAATSPTRLTVDGAAITTPDLVGGKAVVHVIDKVLVTPELAQQLQTPATTGAHNRGSRRKSRKDVGVSNGATSSQMSGGVCRVLGVVLAAALVAAQV